mmetsp:Transcript_11498/g.34536  ORF Transcript_11498/g.34536 Transcript_11498/m.34536 type:complete len:210 (-) Transcript_11498:285-914(-)
MRILRVGIRIVHMVERKLPEQHDDEQHPGSPHVHSSAQIPLPRLPVQHVGRHVHRRPNVREHVHVCIALLGKPEVTQFHAPGRLAIQQCVIQLKIPVGNRVSVAVGHRCDELTEEEARLVLAEVQPRLLLVLPVVRHIACQAVSGGIFHHQAQVVIGQDDLLRLNDVDVPLPQLRLNRDLPEDVGHAWLRQRPADQLDGYLLPCSIVFK